MAAYSWKAASRFKLSSMSNHAPNAYEHDASQACVRGCASPTHAYVGDCVILPVSEHEYGYGVHHHAYGRVHALVPHAHACVHVVLRCAPGHPRPSALRRLTTKG